MCPFTTNNETAYKLQTKKQPVRLPDGLLVFIVLKVLVCTYNMYFLQSLIFP